jgi:phosphate-selective porin OprO/OprP
MKKRARALLTTLAAAALIMAILPATLAQAQSKHWTGTKGQEIELLKLQVRQLQQQVKTLQGLNEQVKVISRKLELQGQTQEAQTVVDHAKSLATPIVRASDEGFRFSSPNDDYRIRFAGIFQANGRFFTSGHDKNSSSTFYVNKARPIVSGAVANYFAFQITPDFGQGKTTLQDAWLNIAYFPQAQLQIGKYKAPVNLERLQSDPYLQFIQSLLNIKTV